MNPDLILPVVSSLGWLILCGVSLASYRLKWGQLIKMALLWITIFLGLFLIAEWFMVMRYAASTVI
jgi:hypothetical protein